MPSAKIFAAAVAAMAMPLVSAGPCKPKSTIITDEVVTTTTADEVITTTAEEPTLTTEAVTTTTAVEACSYYTPIAEPNPDCGKKGKINWSTANGHILSHEGSAANSDECGNICGKTEGCKSFMWKASASECKTFDVVIADLGFYSCESSKTWYDLEVCFSCSEEPSTTTLVESTITEQETTATEEVTETETETEATETETEVETTATEPAVETTATEPAVETTATEPAVETTATEPAVETTATEPEVETTATEPAVETTATEPAVETTATEPAVETTATEPAVETTATEPAATTTDEACPSYTPVQEPDANCGKTGTIPSEKNIFKIVDACKQTVSSEECGNHCGKSEGCKVFSWNKVNGQCDLYSADDLTTLHFNPCTSNNEWYELEKCFSCYNEPEATTTAEEPVITTTAEEPVITTTAEEPVITTTAEEPIITTTAEEPIITTTAEEATTTTAEEPQPTEPAVCKSYKPAFEKCDRSKICGQKGSICKERKIGHGDASCLDNCAKSCKDTEGCAIFKFKAWSRSKPYAQCVLYSQFEFNRGTRNNPGNYFYQPECFVCNDKIVR